MKQTVNDGIQSLIGNLGAFGRDKAASVSYGVPILTDHQLMNAYRGSWIARKVVDIPARDSVRKWRSWQADPLMVTKIEATERRLMLRQKVEEAKIRGRLWGGAAIYIGLRTDGAGTDLMEPIDAGAVGLDGLSYLTVLSRMNLQAGPTDLDPISPYFNRPGHYEINARRVHPSRFVMFYGGDHPEPGWNFFNSGWSDSVLMPVFDAIKNADSVPSNIASLVFEANVDVFGIPDFMESMSDPEYEKRLINRFGLVAANKGINGSILRDATEDYDRKQVTFNGLGDLIMQFLQVVSGASDIPATRLIGRSPAGMSSTGEGDLRNYYDGIAATQELETTPALQPLDEMIIRSSLGNRPADVYYLWSSLWQMDEKTRSEITTSTSKAIVDLSTTGLFSREALQKMAVSSFVDIGAFPGIEAAIEEDPTDFDLGEDDETDDVPKTVTDAAPRSLYISRRVVNSAAIIAWAKAQGFKTTLPGLDLHVTIAYSKTAVDWMKVGPSWEAELKVPPGGPRLMEQFDGGATVLLFASHELEWRHEKVLHVGGSSDYEEYQPHITISYDAADLDLSTVEPYQGEIILGPEIFAEIKSSFDPNTITEA